MLWGFTGPRKARGESFLYSSMMSVQSSPKLPRRRRFTSHTTFVLSINWIAPVLPWQQPVAITSLLLSPSALGHSTNLGVHLAWYHPLTIHIHIYDEGPLWGARLQIPTCLQEPTIKGPYRTSSFCWLKWAPLLCSQQRQASCWQPDARLLWVPWHCADRHNSHNFSFFFFFFPIFEETTLVLSSNCIDFLSDDKPIVPCLDLFTIPIYVQPLC